MRDQLAFEGPGWDEPDEIPSPPGSKWWKVTDPETGRALPGGGAVGHLLAFARTEAEARAKAEAFGWIVLAIEVDG